MEKLLQDFLNQYKNASSPEDSRYDEFFPKGVQRADFLLFDGLIVCEAKVLENVVVSDRVENLVAKERTSGPGFERDIAAPIHRKLSNANKQIKATKKALDYPNALGLIVIENTIPDDYSILTLVSAASRKMLGGLDSVDGVLCMDVANSVSSLETGHIRPIQLMLRKTERSKKLSVLIDRLMSDYGEHVGTTIQHGFSINDIHENWVVDKAGQYKKYKYQFVGTYSTSKEDADWRTSISKWINKWWWVPACVSLLYDLCTS